jgi:hypothetical protein
MPGHAAAPWRTRRRRAPDETQHPFATSLSNAATRTCARHAACHRRRHPQQPASTSAWVGAGIAYLWEQRRGPDERAGSAVSDGHGPAIGCGDEDPDHPGDDQLQEWGRLTLPVRHRPGGNLYPAGARQEFVENVAWKVTQVRPRQRKAHLSIHSRILTEARKQERLGTSAGDPATSAGPARLACADVAVRVAVHPSAPDRTGEAALVIPPDAPMLGQRGLGSRSAELAGDIGPGIRISRLVCPRRGVGWHRRGSLGHSAAWSGQSGGGPG